jgi:hypothetical protein
MGRTRPRRATDTRPVESISAGSSRPVVEKTDDIQSTGHSGRS